MPAVAAAAVAAVVAAVVVVVVVSPTLGKTLMGNKPTRE